MIALSIISLIVSIIGILYSVMTWAAVRQTLLEVQEVHKDTHENLHLQYRKGLEDGMDLVMQKIAHEMQERQAWSSPTGMDN